MRRANKYPGSQVLTEALRYIPKGNNRRLNSVILREQKSFCAYTDVVITYTAGGDLDHFNPTLKNTEDDSYGNWFIVSPKWNKQKGNKWANFQPVLHPTSEDLEERIVYDKGDYITNPDDIPADNLVKLLSLQDPILAEDRKKYLCRKRNDIADSNQTPLDYFTMLLSDHQPSVSYPRAIKAEFGVDVFALITE